MRVSALLDPDAEYEEQDLPIGGQEPTHSLVPECAFSHGTDAVELAEYAGYELMPFQRQGLIDKLGVNFIEQRDGSVVERWAAQETADVISRRNGKSYEIEILILTGLFLLGEKKIMYTAHRDDTAKEVFDNVVAAIKRTPKLWGELVDSGPRYANGQRGITLKNGAVCYFRTRTSDTARGQGYDRLILDESQNLTEAEMAALMPLVSGQPNAQLNYAGSAGGLHSSVQAKVWRSFEAKERGLCYRGWHVDVEADFDDLDLVARVNPRLGRGLSYEFVAKEFRRMTRADFGRERCGAATYPREEGASWVIPEAAVLRATDEASAIADDAPLAFVLESDPELEFGTIGVAGRRADGAMHIEVVAHERGVAWMLDEAKRLREQHGGDIWLDPKGPCGFMVGDFRESGVPIKLFDAADLKDAATWLYTGMNPQPDPRDPGAGRPAPAVYHRGGQLMLQAMAVAETRKLLDRWTWRRSVSSQVAQGPLIAPNLAGYAVLLAERVPTEEVLLPRKGSGQGRQPSRRRPPARRGPSGDFNPQHVNF